jgi:hypothetical protein
MSHMAYEQHVMLLLEGSHSGDNSIRQPQFPMQYVQYPDAKNDAFMLNLSLTSSLS